MRPMRRAAPAAVSDEYYDDAYDNYAAPPRRKVSVMNDDNNDDYYSNYRAPSIPQRDAKPQIRRLRPGQTPPPPARRPPNDTSTRVPRRAPVQASYAQVASRQSLEDEYAPGPSSMRARSARPVARATRQQPQQYYGGGDDYYEEADMGYAPAPRRRRAAPQSYY